MESSVNLCGIRYRVQLADEWTVVFTEDQPCGIPTRFMFDRPKHGLWQFHFCDGWGGKVSACHIVEAYEWCKARIGGDHDEKRLPVEPVVEHQWAYDHARRKCYCGACGVDAGARSKFTSCNAEQPGEAGRHGE